MIVLSIFMIFLIISGVIVYCGLYYNSLKFLIWIGAILFAYILIELLIEPCFVLILTYRKFTNGPSNSSGGALFDTKQDDELLEKGSQRRNHYRHMRDVFNLKILRFNYPFKKQFELLKHTFGGLSHELYRQSIYLIALLLIVYGTRSLMSYYSTEYNKNFITKSELNEMPVNDIHDDHDVWNFIDNNFLPNIHENKNGWIRGNILKVIGVVRLRQIRSRNDSFKRREDTKDYFPKWQKSTYFKYGTYYWRILDPWKYRTGIESKSLPVRGNIQFYPAGGYISQLGRNQNNSLKITEFLRQNNWIDRQTCAILVEYTFYSVDSNLFNVNTIIMEKTEYGNYMIKPYIQTTNLLLILEDLAIITIILFLILIVLKIIFFINLIRELFRNRANFIFNLWNIIDLAIIGMNSGMIIVFFIRNSYVHFLLREMERTRHNEFISFYYAALYDIILTYVGGLLICIATFRLWKILNYFQIFYSLTKTLQTCLKSIAALTLIMIVCLMGYGLCVFIVNGGESNLFYNFTKVLTTLTALSFGFTDNIPMSDLMYGGTTMGIFLYSILLVEFNIFIMNMFITVIIYHLTIVKRERAVTVYTMLQYGKDKLCNISRCCRKKGDPDQPEIKDEHKYLLKSGDDIENEIPNIKGSLHNSTINANVDYATELFDQIDWNDLNDPAIPDTCGLTYRGKKRGDTDLEVLPVEKGEGYCGLAYRMKK